MDGSEDLDMDLVAGERHAPGQHNGHLPGAEFGFFSPTQPTIVKEFVRPGKDISELLMRTRLSKRETQLVTIILYRAEKLGLDKLKDLLRYYLAAKCSEEGIGRKELLQAVTGMVVPSWGQPQAKEERRHR